MVSDDYWLVVISKWTVRRVGSLPPAVCAWGRRRRGRKKLCVHSTAYLSPSAITWQRAPIRDIIAKWYTCISYTCTMKGQNVCSWLPLGFYKVYGRSCIGKYCVDHLICLRKGSRGPKACVKCGIGVKSKIGLCMDCVATDRLITLPIGKGSTGWLQHSSTFPRLAAIEM